MCGTSIAVRKRILIVDDEIANLQYLGKFINTFGHEVVSAPNGKVATQLAESKMPDVIFMDWMMPEKDGISAMKAIRQNPATEHIPIVIITAMNISVDKVQEAFSAGAHGFLRKPFSEMEVFSSLNATLKFADSQKKLREKNQYLENLNNQSKQMASVVAHEFRSPLGKLKGLIELIKMDGDNEEVKEEYYALLDKVIDEGREMVQRFLEICTVEQGGLSLKPSQIDLDTVFSTLIEFQSQFAKAKSIEINHSFNFQKGTFFTDEKILTEIFDNLVSNAIKYSFEGGKIEVGLTSTHDFLELKVKDYGQGIREEEQGKIFNRFAKISSKPTKGENSTGLGLSITKLLVETLNGEISFWSKAGVGSEFVVRLPKMN
ncbi:MAG: two-component system sensor histidine kinase/response regulator [Arenicella sp.]|jgi:two-component system sensor histidine kinase/response regulator